MESSKNSCEQAALSSRQDYVSLLARLLSGEDCGQQEGCLTSSGFADSDDRDENGNSPAAEQPRKMQRIQEAIEMPSFSDVLTKHLVDNYLKEMVNTVVSKAQNETLDFIAHQVHTYNNRNTKRSVHSFWKAVVKHMNLQPFHYLMPAGGLKHTVTTVTDIWNAACVQHPLSDVYVRCQSRATTDVNVFVYYAGHGTLSCSGKTYAHRDRLAQKWYIKHMYQQPRCMYNLFNVYLEQKVASQSVNVAISDTVDTILLNVLFAVEVSVKADLHAAKHSIAYRSIDSRLPQDTLPPLYLPDVLKYMLPVRVLPQSLLVHATKQTQNNTHKSRVPKTVAKNTKMKPFLFIRKPAVLPKTIVALDSAPCILVSQRVYDTPKDENSIHRGSVDNYWDNYW